MEDKIRRARFHTKGGPTRRPATSSARQGRRIYKWETMNILFWVSDFIQIDWGLDQPNPYAARQGADDQWPFCKILDWIEQDWNHVHNAFWLVFWYFEGMFDDLLEAVDATMAHRKDRVAIEDVDFGYSYGTSFPG